MEERIELDDVSAKAVVGTFQVNLQLTQTRQMTITGHLYDTDSAAAINRRVDIYQDTLDRQAIRADITNKEAQIAAMMAGISDHRDQLADLEAKHSKVEAAKKEGKKGAVKFTSQEEAMLRTGQDTIRNAQRNIESLRAAVDAARKKLAGTS